MKFYCLNSFGALYAGEVTGIIYNNEMDDFSTPNSSNYFCLQASETNFIAPGKHPMSSMSPTIILDQHGNVRLTIRAAGGSHIKTSVAKVDLERNCF